MIAEGQHEDSCSLGLSAAVPGKSIILSNSTCALCTREQARLYKDSVATDNSQGMDVWETIIPRLHRSTIYMKLFNLITNNLGYRWEQSNIKDLDFEAVLK